MDNSDDINIDLRVLGIIFVVIMVAVISFFIGQSTSNKLVPGYTREQKIMNMVDTFSDLHVYNIGSIYVNENMTIREVRDLYKQFRNRPIAEGVITQLYDSICIVK